MEAMWTWCFPAVHNAIDLIESGAIGEVRMLTGSFCFKADPEDTERLVDPALAGGALLDVGVYPIAMAHLLLGGEPKSIATTANLCATGVDDQNGIMLKFESGALAVLASAVTVDIPEEILVAGTEGSIRIPPPFFRPNRLIVTRGESIEELTFDYPGMGMHYEATEVMTCLRAGKFESEILPLDASLAVIRTMDRIRTKWGLRYPGE
jgi:predicted dehydrogenase